VPGSVLGTPLIGGTTGHKLYTHCPVEAVQAALFGFAPAAPSTFLTSLVARFIMRRDWPAIVLSAISLGMVVLAADNLLIAVPAVVLCAAIVYSLLFRFGLLSVAVTLFFYFILRRFPLTFDFPQWFV